MIIKRNEWLKKKQLWVSELLELWMFREDMCISAPLLELLHLSVRSTAGERTCNVICIVHLEQIIKNKNKNTNNEEKEQSLGKRTEARDWAGSG